jgi:hypothetical protein
MSDQSQSKPANVREAFCRRYRCKTAEFERKLFLKSLRLHARLLMPFLGWFRPHSFNADWSVVEVVGRVRTPAEMEERISEYIDWNLIDRSRRRRLLFLRVSPSKLRRVVWPLLKNIEPVAAVVENPVLLRSPAPEYVPSPSAPSGVDAPATNGRHAVATITAPRAAAVRAVAHRQADLEERVRTLEAENAQLREIVAQNAIELAKLGGIKR